MHLSIAAGIRTCLLMFHHRLSLVWGRWDTAILCLFTAGWVGGGLGRLGGVGVLGGVLEGWGSGR